jgi:hypothetical protein
VFFYFNLGGQFAPEFWRKVDSPQHNFFSKNEKIEKEEIRFLRKIRIKNKGQ